MTRVDRVASDSPNAFAIIGMSGRFPGASDVEALWRNLIQGVESIRRFTADDLLSEGVDPRLLAEPDHVPAGGALDDVDRFDAGFFGFTPREAEVLDPQHRIFLECAWEALELAGYPAARFAGGIGVFAGAGASTHLHRLLGSPELVRSLGSLQITIGNEKDHLSTRAAYKLGLRGPAVTVQTTCSSSLVAVALACGSLQAGQCDIALAGGVSIVLPQRIGYRYRSGGILSPDGHCRAFDAAAAGAVGGNGAGVVALRRLSDAVLHGDYIHAVIRGTALNNDGSVKVGYTAPSIAGQAAVITRAHQAAGVSPSAISYVEAHGTGTSLGDPIEIAALTEAFGGRVPDAPKTCRIGSVKTNIGHLDAAAGVAGLIKVVLALNHEMVPQSLHFREPNPELHLDETPFTVASEATSWPAEDEPRLAGVSSFGIGGTNAHVVVEEAPTRASGPDVDWPLLLVSARSAEAADRACVELADHLDRHPEVSLTDTAFTLQSGRQFFRHRRAVVGRNRSDVVSALRAGGRGMISGRAVDDEQVSFLLPGQGSQRPGMGRELYRCEPAFRAELDACCDLLTPVLGLDVRDLLVGDIADEQAAEQTLRRTEVAQPALFVVEMALAAALDRLGVRPVAMLGHSLGELVAACLAGVFTRHDALLLVAARGRLMGAAPPGDMLAVSLGESELVRLLTPGVEIAAVNSATLCTVSGPFEAIREFRAVLTGHGVTAQQLRVSHAFHSASMESPAGRFAKTVAEQSLSRPAIRYLSNVTGTWVSDDRATDPAAWGEHIRARVRFADCARELLDTDTVLVEVGPGGVLSGLARQAAPHGRPAKTVRILPGAGDQGSESLVWTEAIGGLWVAGVDIDWTAFAGDRPSRRVPLPTYPFERSRFWIDTPARTRAVARPSSADGHGARRPMGTWISVPSWRRTAPVVGAVAPATVALLGAAALADALADELNRRGCTVRRSDEPAQCLGSELVVDLRALMPAPLDPIDVFEASTDLIKTLSGQPNPAAPTGTRLVQLTDRAQDVTGAESVRPEQALLHGLARVARQEHTGLSVRSVDIVVPGCGPSTVADLAEELCGAPNVSVALRNGYRWLPGFTTVEGDPPGRSRLRPGGTYLITGGIGRVGLSIADLLASTGAAIAFMSRTELPPRERWATAAESRSPSARVLRRLYAMERAGARILTLAADVSDRGAMAAALSTIVATFGSLDGVIHAAGAVGPETFAPIVDLDRGLIERHFAPKVMGTQILDELLGADVPPLALLTSSLSAELGGLGFGAYAAANAFLDAFASGPGRGRWTSIAWEGWRFGATGDQPAEGLAALALTPTEGAAVFSRIANLPAVPRFVVSTGDLDERVRSWVLLEPIAKQRSAPAQPGHARPELETSYVVPSGEIEQTIASALQDLLGIESIGRDDDFFALGGHSLLAIQLISRLRDAFRVELSLHALFDGPTVAEIGKLVLEGRDQVANAEDERLADLLDLVEGMTEAEVAALLAAEVEGSDG